ncbi:M48 family metalloprotease [Halococcoides cellulosivorans]|nr:M48 family metalloprotease [Halococcoides cellulosivorans]
MNAAVGSRRLTVRMLATLVALVVLTGTLAVGIWAMAWALCRAMEIRPPALWATVVTALVFVTVATLDYRRDREQGAERTPVEPGDRVHRIATRIARQFDLPVPRLVIAERPAPVAMAVGHRSGDPELVVSRGTLDALDDDELEAVIAHEFAHLANRDAWVMRVAATPVMIADGITDRLRVHSPRDLITGVMKLFALTTEWSGRIVVAIFGRERERAADRAAARVTGSPAALASALATLDASVAETPDRDLRSVAGESTMSIVALDDPTEPLMLGPDGERRPVLWPVRKRFRVWTRSHPPTAERIERLQAMAADQS